MALQKVMFKTNDPPPPPTTKATIQKDKRIPLEVSATSTDSVHLRRRPRRLGLRRVEGGHRQQHVFLSKQGSPRKKSDVALVCFENHPTRSTVGHSLSKVVVSLSRESRGRVARCVCLRFGNAPIGPPNKNDGFAVSLLSCLSAEG